MPKVDIKLNISANEILMSLKQILYVNKDLIIDLETRQGKYMYSITDNTIFKDKNSDKS